MGKTLTSTDLRKAIRALRNNNSRGPFQVIVHPDAEYDLREQINELMATADVLEKIDMEQEMRTAVERWRKRFGT